MDIGQAEKTLSPFIVTALSKLDEEDVRIVGNVRMLAECYIYGAIRYMATYDEMRPASTDVLIRHLLSKHFKADNIEVDNCLKFCSGIKDGKKEKLFMMEGAGALRRWLVNNDKSVANELKDLMIASSISVA